MKQEVQMVRPTQAPATWAPSRPRREELNQTPPLEKMHRLLRGRYPVAITLAIILGLGLAAAGFLIPKPQFRSDGLIEIKPNIPSLADTTAVMPLYTQYVESQVNMILGQRVITSAMESDEWRPFSKGLDPKALKEFTDNLEVEYVHGTFLIRASYTDSDPTRAQTAVKAIVRSYMQLYGDVDTKDLRDKLQYLDNMRASIAHEKKSREDQLLTASRKYGTLDLSELHNARIREMIALEDQLTQAQIQLAAAQAALGKSKDASATQPAGMELGLAQIAKVDERMRAYLAQRDQATDDLDRLRQHLGVKNPMVQESENHLSDLNSRIDAYAQEFRSENSGVQIATAGHGPTAVTPQMIEQLKQNVAYLSDHDQKQSAEVVAIGNTRVEIQTLQNDITDLEQKLSDANRNWDQLNVQLAMSGRINPLSYGDRPNQPAVDNRRKLATLGFLGGGSLPFVFFMLIGLADKRYRYSDETDSDSSGIPLLGILPNLPDLLNDPQQAAVAAHCVHQIRSLLQVGVRTQDRHVYAITSAAPGDGKTSLALALGLSFAASGSRTLILDCDLIGGALTRRLDASAPEGITEAMSSGHPLDYVRNTDVENLSIIPVGSGASFHTAAFSPSGIRRVITEARQSYDIVLIDTGPILGSIEAPSVTAAADATIVCVSRGQHRPAVDRSIQHLLAIGAKIAGIVFNRAESRDFERSVSRFSQRSIRTEGEHNGQTLRLPNKTHPETSVSSTRVDPVSRAVANDFNVDQNHHDPR